MNYRCVIRYDGSSYRGFQRQGNQARTIQSKLESLLSKAIEQPVEIFGSGRTDAGVHALAQVINFHLAQELSADQVMQTMNRYLPEDIQVLSCEAADARFHARLSATAKTYVYHIHVAPFPDAFRRKYEWHLEQWPDTELMNQAARQLLGRHDFRGFTEKQGAKKSTVRTIQAIQLETEEVSAKEMRIHVTVTANGFLYHMVRLIVGTLVEIALGRTAPDTIITILETGERSLATLAPAHGLFLSQVEYEEK